MQTKKDFRFKNLTPGRIITAFLRRFKDIPNRLLWETEALLNKENIKGLQKFKNIHMNERCFIIGNGPSLRSMNLNLIHNEYAFGLNRIYLLFDKYIFRPTYFVSINNLVLQQFSSEIIALDMPKFIDWNMRKYYPDNHETINFLKLGLGLKDKFAKDITSQISSGGTVTYVAMQLAYWMGFKEVILIGVDHNFSDKGTPNKTEVRKSNVDENHFHPNYFPKGSKWQLPDLLRSEIAYRLAKEAFEDDGRRILDATVGGKLQVFPKVNFEDIISNA
jgi:hypothetical protein